MKKTVLLAVLCVAGVGCVSVPTSQIRFGEALARLPKDSSADYLKIEVKSGTNSLVFEAKKWSTRNNPAVIASSSEQIEAHYKGMEGLAAKAIEAGMKGAKP